MNYYITFETVNFGSSLSLMGQTKSEMTWVCSEAELEMTLERVALNKHKVIRIVKGEEVELTQEVKIKAKAQY